MYVVVWGCLRQIIDDAESLARDLPDVHRGQLVGDFAVLGSSPRTATVSARRDSLLLRIDRRQFEDLAERFAGLGLSLARDIARRVGQANRPPRRAPIRAQTLAIAPVDASDAYRSLAAELSHFLSASGEVLCLTRESFEAKYCHLADPQSRHPDDPLVGAILAAQEANYKLILYVADAKDSSWSARCLRQADKILYVARGRSAAHEEHPLERRARQQAPGTPRFLILVHDAAVDRPTDTARWLRPDRFTEHFHLRDGDPVPMRRLVRRLTGQAIGLVLSGGGARGYAHLGVWRAIEEFGIPIDYFCGTSMGALAAAAFAMPMVYADMFRTSIEVANADSLFDKTLPIVSIMASRKLNRVLRKFYGDVLIEDLWIPFFCVSTNLTTAEPVLFDRGPLWEAVRASISIPGVFAPVVQNRHLLVDGGVIDNFPVTEMQRRCQSTRTIAVNVVPYEVKARDYDMTNSISGWRVLLNRINPFCRRRRYPSIINTMLRALEINSIRRGRRQRSLAEVLIEPDVRSVGLLRFEEFRNATDIGYESARHQLQRWMDTQQMTPVGVRTPTDRDETVQIEAA